MKITNIKNLPAPIVAAVQNMVDQPRSSDGDKSMLRISVTRLIDSPMIANLEREYWHDITEDASERLWALFGTAVAKILESAHVDEDGHAEKGVGREFVLDDGRKVRVTGRLDRFAKHEGELQDYKVTSAWSIIFGKEDWPKQLNLYRYLLDPDMLHVKRLAIYALLRDWQRSRAAREADYPQDNMIRVEIPMWPNEECELYIAARLRAHFVDPPGCSDGERWAKPGSFAVMKEGRKTAMRVLPTSAEASKWVEAEGLTNTKGISIIERPATFPRCENYCNVAQWCPIWSATAKARADGANPEHAE